MPNATAPTPTDAGNHDSPRATRPAIVDYGIPADAARLLPWSHVTARMVAARFYWICTVSSDHRPHATPVDGLWLDDQLYFGGSAKTRRHRNLAENNQACIHLESGTDVVILHGTVKQLQSPDAALSRRLANAATEKYGYASEPQDYAGGGVYVFSPHTVFAWKNFPYDATRWLLTYEH